MFAVLRVYVAFVLERKVVSLPVLPLDRPAVDAAELLVIRFFDSVESGVFGAHEPNDVRGERAVRIYSLGAFFQAYLQRKLVFGDKFAHFHLDVFFEILFDDLVLGILSRRFFEYLGFFDSEYARKPIGYQFRLRVVRDILRRDENGLHCGARGEQFVVAVVYIAAFRLYGYLRGVLIGRRVFVLFGIDNLQYSQPIYQITKT